jgi:hypothetical protein
VQMFPSGGLQSRFNVAHGIQDCNWQAGSEHFPITLAS